MARVATKSVRFAALDLGFPGLADIEVTPKEVEAMEACPAMPTSNPERRVRLLAVVLALGVDRATVSKLVGI